MIFPTPDTMQKIELLDKLLGALSLEDLQAMAETEQVVARLKGTENNPKLLTRLVQEHDQMSSNFMTLQGDFWSLKEDVKTLIKITTKPYEPYVVSEFNSLKSKHGIY